MTLSFKLQLNGKPTYFPEKIISALFNNQTYSLLDIVAYYNPFLHSKYRKWETLGETLTPKLHTIRADKSNRWKAGNKIHFVINNRTPERMQFAPVVECAGVQFILIYPYKRVVIIAKPSINYLPLQHSNRADCGRYSLSEGEVCNLAINDGFDTVEAFWEYFNEPFQGKIIHWTDLTY